MTGSEMHPAIEPEPMQKGLGDVTRRSVVGFAAAATAGVLLTAGARTSPGVQGSLNRMWDTIVIGAGPAGLGAARVIADAGKKVLVLEARNRTGGRLWTDSTSMTIPFERGAELVHGNTVSTWDLINQQGLQTHRFEKTFGKYNASDAAWVDASTFETFHFPEGAPSFPGGLPEPLDGETALDWLNRIGIPRSNYPISVLAIEVDTEQFDVLPAEFIFGDVEFALSLQGESGPMPPEAYGDYRVIGGYKQVLQPLAAGIPIVLNSPVTSIDYRNKNRVEVHVGSDTYKARTIVLAVPGGVLKNGDITFNPPLPAARSAAIQEISYLSVFKAILEFAEPVLPVGMPSTPDWDILTPFDMNPPSTWNASEGTPGYTGQLVVTWMTGGKAQALLDLPEQDRLAAALETVRATSGKPDLEYVNASTYDWSKDQYARGAYPGPFSRRSGLNTPINNTLFWAGMTTSTVHSSRNSGIVAANQALAALA
ncbi:flavin monoamine oxidase family protein [Leifsonia sp. YAF41]|uniref:flavin monoamine oxidase family protein n=1 Tax=Leifsonia sp. YAF41 TaxID=3233086 RepID=UPI003F9601C3